MNDSVRRLCCSFIQKLRRVQGSGFRIQDFGFRISDSGFERTADAES